MSAERDDGLQRRLVAANPVDLAGLAGVADDARSREDLERILALPRGRPRRARRAVSLGIAAALVLGVVVALALTGALSSTSADATPPGILKRPTTVQDRLPAWIQDNVTTKMFGVIPSTARFAMATPTRRYWVARSKLDSRQQTCLIDALARDPSATYRPGSPGGINCQSDGVFAQDFIVTNVTNRPGITELSGIVPNGYSQVHVDNVMAPVVNNVFEITEPPGPQAPSITATGSAGSRTVWFFTWQVLNAQQPVKSPVLPFALFSTRPTPTASLPASIRSRLTHGQHAWAIGTDRYGGRYWLISTGRPKAAASVAVGGGPASGLDGPIALPTKAQPLAWIGFPHGSLPPYDPETNLVVGLVPNGYTSATTQGRTVPVRHNAFVLGDVTSRPPVLVVATGPGGSLRTQLLSGADQYRGILQPPGKK